MSSTIDPSLLQLPTEASTSSASVLPAPFIMLTRKAPRDTTPDADAGFYVPAPTPLLSSVGAPPRAAKIVMGSRGRVGAERVAKRRSVGGGGRAPKKAKRGAPLAVVCIVAGAEGFFGGFLVWGQMRGGSEPYSGRYRPLVRTD